MIRRLIFFLIKMTFILALFAAIGLAIYVLFFDPAASIENVTRVLEISG